MSQVINTNSLSLITQNNMNKTQSALGTAIERLSSGLRINSAKDDAAGQAISNRFTANIRGLAQAARNANDGISIAQTTEGSLEEINNNLQRIRELVVQATSGTNSSSDITSIQDEIKSRLDEIDRVSNQTQFNGIKVLEGAGNGMKIQVGANDNETVSLSLEKIDSVTLGLKDFSVTTSVTTKGAGDISFDTSTVKGPTELSSKHGAFDTSKVYKAGDGQFYLKTKEDKGDDDSVKGKYYKVSVNNEGKVTVETTAKAAASTPTGLEEVRSYTPTAKEIPLNATGVTKGPTELKGGKLDTSKIYRDSSGKYYLKSDNNANDTKLRNRYYHVNVSSDGKVTVDDAATAEEKDPKGIVEATVYTPTDNKAGPLQTLDAAIAHIDKFRSSLGAIQNRLNSAVSNLNNTVTNLAAARSRIQDADYATEVSNMSRAQIVQQAGNSVLAKANQVPQLVLSLLRD